MIKEAIKKLVERRSLTTDETVSAMNEVMSGEATPAQVAAFVIALRMKGETIDEVVGCARVMRAKATPVHCPPSAYEVIDTCGTGGDLRDTFNISTVAALVAAGAGVTVAKHGNRAASSHCGSADVLKQLGVNVEAPVPVVEACLRDCRIGFLFAVKLHETMKNAIGPRREIGVRTVFNMLGPLTNPAGARCQLVGVYDPALPVLLAEVFRQLGSLRCMVVHGDDGLDEITTTGRTNIAELRNGQVANYTIGPEDVGLPRAKLSDLTAHTAEDAAAIAREVLAGRKGPHRDIVLLNAGAAIMVSGAADNLPAAIKRAADSIDSGAAAKVLDRLIACSQANETEKV